MHLLETAQSPEVGNGEQNGSVSGAQGTEVTAHAFVGQALARPRPLSPAPQVLAWSKAGCLAKGQRKVDELLFRSFGHSRTVSTDVRSFWRAELGPTMMMHCA